MLQDKNNALERVDITAIILSGGEGRRVGGQDKGLLNFQGRSLIEHVAERISPQVDNTVISINRNQDTYSKLGFSFFFDDTQENTQQGPLAGVISVLDQLPIESNYFLICTCDSPMLPIDYVSKLKCAITSSESDVSVVFDGVATQNLHCLISAAASPSLIQFYQDGGRAIRHWLSLMNAVHVDFSEQANAFVNFNTLESIS